jgi:hypothetical protein
VQSTATTNHHGLMTTTTTTAKAYQVRELTDEGNWLTLGTFGTLEAADVSAELWGETLRPGAWVDVFERVGDRWRLVA